MLRFFRGVPGGHSEVVDEFGTLALCQLTSLLLAKFLKLVVTNIDFGLYPRLIVFLVPHFPLQNLVRVDSIALLSAHVQIRPHLLVFMAPLALQL